VRHFSRGFLERGCERGKLGRCWRACGKSLENSSEMLRVISGNKFPYIRCISQEKNIQLSLHIKHYMTPEEFVLSFFHIFRTPLLDMHSQTSLSTSPRVNFEARSTSSRGRGKFIRTDPALTSQILTEGASLFKIQISLLLTT